MGDVEKPYTSVHIFKKVVWRNTLAIVAILEQSTTWTITSVAAILALLISNIDTEEKSLFKMLNFQIYLNALHGLMAAAALLILAFSI